MNDSIYFELFKYQMLNLVHLGLRQNAEDLVLEVTLHDGHLTHVLERAELVHQPNLSLIEESARITSLAICYRSYGDDGADFLLLRC